MFVRVNSSYNIKLSNKLSQYVLQIFFALYQPHLSCIHIFSPNTQHIISHLSFVTSNIPMFVPFVYAMPNWFHFLFRQEVALILCINFCFLVILSVAFHMTQSSMSFKVRVGNILGILLVINVPHLWPMAYWNLLGWHQWVKELIQYFYHFFFIICGNDWHFPQSEQLV